MLDREYADRMIYFCTQLDESTFVCWNFVKGNLDEDNYGWPWSELPQFHMVCKVTIQSFLGNKYIKCSYCFCEHVGIPCQHMFCATDGESDVNMMDIRCWKALFKNYGEDSFIGTFSMVC